MKLSLNQIADGCLRLLTSETGWVVRRKESLDVSTETLLRHHLSVDFEIPRAILDEDEAGRSRAFVPLTFLRKAPGKFTRFDFEDETGRALPLPTRDENAKISSAMLLLLAQRVLGANGKALTRGLATELRYIARGHPDRALELINHRWLVPSPGPRSRAPRAKTDHPIRGLLASDPEFWWLLRTVAYSSLVMVAVDGEPGERRILKLSYDEEIDDVTVVAGGVRRRARALASRLGWRGYLVHVVSPHIAACNYHFELHAPPGLQIVEAQLRAAEQAPLTGIRKRVHFYVPGAEDQRSTAGYVQFRVRGPGFVGGAAFTSLVIALVVAVAWWQAEELAGRATSAAPSLLLLFPGVVATYLARPEHPLVTRLLNLARWTLVASAGVAYVCAARLALVSSAHPATAEQLERVFEPATYVAGALAAILVATRRLPMRVSGGIRRAARRLMRRPLPL